MELAEPTLRAEVGDEVAPAFADETSADDFLFRRNFTEISHFSVMSENFFISVKFFG